MITSMAQVNACGWNTSSITDGEPGYQFICYQKQLNVSVVDLGFGKGGEEPVTWATAVAAAPTLRLSFSTSALPSAAGRPWKGASRDYLKSPKQVRIHSISPLWSKSWTLQPLPLLPHPALVFPTVPRTGVRASSFCSSQVAAWGLDSVRSVTGHQQWWWVAGGGTLPNPSGSRHRERKPLLIDATAGSVAAPTEPSCSLPPQPQMQWAAETLKLPPRIAETAAAGGSGSGKEWKDMTGSCFRGTHDSLVFTHSLSWI